MSEWENIVPFDGSGLSGSSSAGGDSGSGETPPIIIYDNVCVLLTPDQKIITDQYGYYLTTGSLDLG